jgi:hypothetical protein
MPQLSPMSGPDVTVQGSLPTCPVKIISFVVCGGFIPSTFINVCAVRKACALVKSQTTKTWAIVNVVPELCPFAPLSWTELD